MKKANCSNFCAGDLGLWMGTGCERALGGGTHERIQEPASLAIENSH